MKITLRPSGRGNWKTRVVWSFHGPQAPGPLAYKVGQRILIPIGYGLTHYWRIVEIRA